MKNINLRLVTAATLAAGTLISAGASRAEDLGQTKARKQAAVTKGLSESSLALLQRGSSQNQTEVSAALVAKMRPVSTYETFKAGGKLTTTGDQWTLAVSSDGSAAEYRDLAVMARAHSLGKPLSQNITAEELEQKGRAFIASSLASQITLGEGEQLIALRADNRSEGGKDLATGVESTAVVANRIVFGRLINGVPVVGNGSKVIVTFTNDGAVESFRYDWPTYQSGSTQTVVGAPEVLSRVQKIVALRNGETMTGVVAVSGSVANPYPVSLSAKTQLQSLECGYYDSGSETRKSNTVQAGCTYLTVSQDANGMRAGLAGAVPAGATVAPDAGWIEAQILTAK